MEEIQRERLYHLLPSIYRMRDRAQGEPLRALMNTLENEWRLVEEDIDALYDNWFIETCDEWVIPYLAGHVGTSHLEESGKVFPGQRRLVANTIGYRRRKGLKPILEHALADATGWYIHCVEYDPLLSHTQHLTNNFSTGGNLVNLRDTSKLAVLNSSFEAIAHTVDVRNIGHESSRNTIARALPGKYRPGNLGIFIWRLRSYPLKLVPARAITHMAGHALAPGCFTFDPLGRDIPLFNQPQIIDTLTQSIEPVHLPMPISRFALAEDLEEYHRQYPAQSEESPFEEDDLLHNSVYYGPDRALCVLLNDAPLPPNSIISADLSQWHLPLDNARRHESRVAIDVVLGRLRFLDASLPKANDVITVNYSYAFSSDLGGGPYMRPALAISGTRYRVNVLQNGKVSTLRHALSEWDNYCRAWEEQHQSADPLQEDRPCGTIHIVDNGLYIESDLIINLPKNGDLVIEATAGARPVIEGTLRIKSEYSNAQLRLNGLLLHGNLVVEGGLDLEVRHCTLMPYGIETQPSSSSMRLTIDHSIVGPVQMRNRQGTLAITNSIIDHAAASAINALHPDGEHGSVMHLERTTIFGRVQARVLLQGLNVLFTEPVVIRDCLQGLISFSYIPAHSQTPRREHCLSPSMEIAHSAEQLTNGQSESEQIEPLFTSTHYGNAAYAQLATHCSPRIQRGADNGSEIGVFNSLRQVQRADNIPRMLDEYLPFGLSTGVFYMT